MAKRKQDENLVSLGSRTTKEKRAIAIKGGKASGKARREKADLRKSAQALLDATFTDKKTGQTLTGQEIVLKGLIANLSDPKSRNWGKAMEMLNLYTGNNLLKEQIEKIKAETELVKAKTKAVESSAGTVTDIEDLTPIAKMLEIDEDGDNEDCDN